MTIQAAPSAGRVAADCDVITRAPGRGSPADARDRRDLLAVLDLGVLGVDDLLVAALRTARLGAAASLLAGVLLRVGVHRLAELLRRLAQRLGLRLELFLRRVLVLQDVVGVLEGRLDLRLLVA